MADGSLVFNTKLDNSGLDKEIAKAKAKLNKANSAVKKQSQVVDRQTAKVREAAAAYDAQNAAVKRLKEQYRAFLESGQDPKALTQAQRELDRTEKSIEKLRAELEKYKAEMSAAETWAQADKSMHGAVSPESAGKLAAAENAASDANARLEEAVGKAERLRDTIKSIQADPTASAEAQKMRDGIDAAERKAEALGHKVDAAAASFSSAGAKMSELQAKEQSAAGSLREALNPDTPGAFARGMEKASGAMQKFANRVKRLAARVFIFSVITRAFRSLLSYIGKASMSSEGFSKAWGRLKGNLLTALQPILDKLIPALTTLVNWLADAAAYLAQFIALLFGTSVKSAASSAEALNKEANGLEAVAGAADEARHAVQGFDELNVVNSDAKESEKGAPSFELAENEKVLPTWLSGLTGVVDGIKAALSGIIAFVKGVFAGDWEAAWDGLLQIAAGVRDAFVPILEGLSGAVGSAIDWVIDKFGLADAWLGDALLALKTMFQGAIDFVCGILTGDWERALDGARTFAQGVLDGICAGLDLLEIAFDFVADAVAKIVFDCFGVDISGYVEAAKETFGGLITFLKGVFTGDWEMMWTGIKDFFRGIWNGIIEILEGAINLLVKGLNWLIDQINKVGFDTPDWMKQLGVKADRIGFNIGHVDEVSLDRIKFSSGTEVPTSVTPITPTSEIAPEVGKAILAIADKLTGDKASAFVADFTDRIVVEIDGDAVYDKMMKRNYAATKRSGTNPLVG